MTRSVLLALALAATSVQAATVLGFGIEADYYVPEAQGHFNYKNTATALSGDEDSGYQIGAYLEHPVPMLPNVRIDVTPKNSFSGTAQGGGVNKVSFEQVDITPYYEILDNVVDLDVGIAFKVLDGQIEGAIHQSFNEVIPMGYLGAALTLPGVPVSFSGSVKYIGYNGDSLTDARIKAIWDIAAGIQAQAGYRHESLKIDDRFDMNSDVTFKGPFVGIGFAF